MIGEEEKMLDGLKAENKSMFMIIASRNKLTNDLLELPSLSQSDYKKGLWLRKLNWENDKVILIQAGLVK